MHLFFYDDRTFTSFFLDSLLELAQPNLTLTSAQVLAQKEGKK